MLVPREMLLQLLATQTGGATNFVQRFKASVDILLDLTSSGELFVQRIQCFVVVVCLVAVTVGEQVLAYGYRVLVHAPN